MVTITVTGTVQVTSPWVHRPLGVSGVHGDDRGLVRRTSRLLTGRVFTIVTTVPCDETLGSCTYHPGDSGGDPGFLTGWILRSRCCFEVVPEVIVGVGFCDPLIWDDCDTVTNVDFFSMFLI